MQKFILSAFVVALVAADCALKCPDGYFSFKRAPSAKNSMTGLWCVKAILSDTLISPNQAKQVCEKDGSILTSFENLDERTKLATVLRDFLSAKKLDRGGMIVDGHRLKNCETDDRTVLNAEPCRNSSTGFTTDEKHTDNTFMWKSWADTEPGQSIFEKQIESCLQLAISQFKSRTELINDVFCNYVKHPQNEGAYDLWNYGAVCGRLPEWN
ncbi:C-type lectin domain-containing protein 158 [Caenorhabditis elegans]|uniref:C-type lectin domain-containing protein 158 n=1 Tax=Caenorhabditis elegans TaxID=6239 RepID=CL158_CAEEL|nr:C-type lectin domain-containing protein 158 [Caenorhabditis elegans]Q21984.1 RecName: Full=C-type lectin domain-containing protein 158; Flags: Precursor [Caenorhabditis elegans]CCD70179.1 C-type lectin domain-containing protein 158 [Caenorhabditis elegans]|eukprot:NP_498491.1 C-type lectin domain-containing protein 158 [Caenorhabditis elegans]